MDLISLTVYFVGALIMLFAMADWNIHLFPMAIITTAYMLACVYLQLTWYIALVISVLFALASVLYSANKMRSGT